MKQARKTSYSTPILFTFILLFVSTTMWAGKKTKIKKVSGIEQILLIKFKDSTSDSTIQKIAVKAYDLQKKSRTLKSVEWGKKTTISDDTKDYDYCLILSFKSETDFEIFHENPIRLEFMGKLIPLSQNIIKFTYRGEKAK